MYLQATILGAMLLSAFAHATLPEPMFQVIYGDEPGTGFQDPTPVEPVAGNPARTLGEQRRAVLEAGLEQWATFLDSQVPIRVHARFVDLACGMSLAAGTGQPSSFQSNFGGAPRADTEYPIALARALSGQALGSDDSDIEIRLNLRIDQDADCMPGVPEGFWYGLDQRFPYPPGTMPFLPLIQHEIAHGLGFMTLANLATGHFYSQSDYPGIFDTRLYSVSRDTPWGELDPDERIASMTEGDDLAWDGDRTNARAAEYLLPPTQLHIPSGSGDHSAHSAWMQGFPPFVQPPGLTATLQIAVNATDQSSTNGEARLDTDACEPLHNEEAEDSIMLVTRGACDLDTKWRHVFEAGAAAMLVADNVAEDAAASLSRAFFVPLYERQPIPLWTVTEATGQSLLDHRPETVTLGFDEDESPIGMLGDRTAMMDGGVAQGVNVSHFGFGHPHTLMSVTGPWYVQFSNLDLTPDLLHDIGWPDASGKLSQLSGMWFDPERAGEGCQLTAEGDNQVFVLTCYLHDNGEQAWLIATGHRDGGHITFHDTALTTGADYGGAFDPDDVVQQPFGTIEMEIIDCNNAWFRFYPELDGYRAFHSMMRRIVPASCLIDPRHTPQRDRSGMYFDPDRSGEGIQITWAHDHLFILTFYRYLNGKQLWLVGTGQLDDDHLVIEDLHLAQGSGYGHDFDPEDVETLHFGRMELTFQGCNTLEVMIEPDRADLETEQLQMTRIVTRDC